MSELFSQGINPVAMLRAERAKSDYPDTASYLNTVMRRYVHHPAFNLYRDFITDISEAVIPLDRTTGEETDRGIGDAFFAGAWLGFHVLRKCVSKEVRELIPDVEVGQAHSAASEDDALQALHEDGSQIIENGDRGLAEHPELTELLTEWEEEAFPDVRVQRFFRCGFGVMLFAADQANLQIQFQTGDWDTAAANELFFPPEPPGQ